MAGRDAWKLLKRATCGKFTPFFLNRPRAGAFLFFLPCFLLLLAGYFPSTSLDQIKLHSWRAECRACTLLSLKKLVLGLEVICRLFASLELANSPQERCDM